MRAIAIYLARCGSSADEKPVFLAACHDVSSFSFVEKKAVRELCAFLSRTMLPRLEVGKREVITHEGYIAAGLRWPDGLGAMMVVDKEYPPRLAFVCLGKACETFRTAVDDERWKTVKTDHSVGFKDQLKGILAEYRDPSKFDSVVKTQAKVDDVKAVMEKNIEDLLKNNEDLDALVKQSEDVSDQSKAMFATSKKMSKGCCSVM